MFKCLIVIVFTLSFSLFSEAAEFQTSAEKSNWTRLTTHQQLMEYLAPLVESSPTLRMQSIGTSVSGKSIPALFFSKDEVFASQRDTKPVVMIIAAQHGNEPSSKEAAMIVTRRLLDEDSDLLDKLDLILVPLVNPDGSDAGERRNSNDMDLNRNHVVLSEPESNAVHQLFLDWMPEVTLDVHEYNAVLKTWTEAGYIKDADEMLGGVTNLNIDPEIVNFSRDTFIPETGKGIVKDGFRFHRYVVGDPFEDKVVRYSTTAINDGRQSFGIYNTLSFIIEGKRYGNLSNELEKRTRGQVSAMINFLRTTERHAETIKTIVGAARERMADSDRSYIQMEYFPDESQPTLNFPVFDLDSWTAADRDIEHFKPLVKIKKSVSKPAAYFFPATETELIELLNRHRIPMLHLQGQQKAETETYRVKHITDAVDEEKPTLAIDLEKTVQDRTLEDGTILVPVHGAAANLVPLLLEPESTWGIVSSRAMGKYRFETYLAEGKPYPVGRLSSIEQLSTK